MKFLKLPLIVLTSILTSNCQAQVADGSPIHHAGNEVFEEQDLRQGIFPSEESGEMQKEEEEPELDSFGEDQFNQNRYPEEFTIDDEY